MIPVTAIKKHYESISHKKLTYQRIHNYYYSFLASLFQKYIGPNHIVAEMGCGCGYLLSKLKTKKRIGIDISINLINVGEKNFKDIEYHNSDVSSVTLPEKPDIIICSDFLGEQEDLWSVLENIRSLCSPNTRILVSQFNYMWKPLIYLLEILKLKTPTPLQNYLSLDDLENMLYLTDFRIIKTQKAILLPIYLPLISSLINNCIPYIPLLKNLCWIDFLIAEPVPYPERQEKSCTVIIPCRNEKGNIRTALERLPNFSQHLEIIFVDGNSNDGTREEIEKCIDYYKERDIKLINQVPNTGKADAVWMGFDAAQGDILMILDADITVPPEDLPKFYELIITSKGEFINGTRLVYTMEDQAMRTLNYFANRIFGKIFSYLLNNRITDTLCGTKAISKKNCVLLKNNIRLFGNFDPFGDFQLIFGAAYLKLRYAEIPIVYRNRKWGDIKIERFKHGWLLLKMCFIALKKFKLHL